MDQKPGRGGARAGAGRPKGMPNKSTLERQAASQALLVATLPDGGFQGSSLDLLKLVYKNEALPLSIRVNAAEKAARYEHPTMVMRADAAPQMNPEQVDARLRELLSRSSLPLTIEAEVEDE